MLDISKQIALLECTFIHTNLDYTIILRASLPSSRLRILNGVRCLIYGCYYNAWIFSFWVLQCLLALFNSLERDKIYYVHKHYLHFYSCSSLLLFGYRFRLVNKRCRYRNLLLVYFAISDFTHSAKIFSFLETHGISSRPLMFPQHNLSTQVQLEER